MRTVAFALALVVAVGCSASYVAVRPTEPLTAAAPGLRAVVTRVFVTDDVRDSGVGDGSRLVVELRVRNEGAAPRQLSPGSFSCLMELDARRPGETRGLQPAGGGEGPFPGEVPDQGSVLAGVTIPPGAERDVWAIFHGYRFEGSELQRKVTMKVPLEGGGALELVLADPARGGLRWEMLPPRAAFVVGIRSDSLAGSALRGVGTSTELSGLWRLGRLRLDAGLLSTVFVQIRGPLVSESSAFSGSGLTAHVVVPVLSWGKARAPYQLGIYGGGAATLLLEIPKRTPDEKAPLHTYGLYSVEAGLELAGGTLPFAESPFPLTRAPPSLPRWALRLGYLQSWAGGLTSGGSVTTLRFTW